MHDMRYTVRNIPDEIDRTLRERARSEGKSLNDVVLEVLQAGMSLGDPRPSKRDLSDVWGRCEPDPSLDAAVAECRQIDREEWQ